MDAFHDSLPETPEPRESTRLFVHHPVLERLLDDDASGRLHHAHIFSGPAGIGKATTAFHLARVLLTKGLTQDEAFAGARKIANGSHPNLLHIARPKDQKGERFKTVITVDEIRQIGAFLGLTSGAGARRIIIVDGAEQMNANAANALLKNLEEPPANTQFFLIAGQGGRLLPTIRSRCNLVRFSPPSVDDCAAILQTVGHDQADAAILARRAGGNPRDAIVLARYGGLEIEDTVKALLTVPRPDPARLQDFVRLMTERDREVQYDLAIRNIVDTLAGQARRLALGGQTEAASGLAEEAAELAGKVRIAAAYGVDRRLHLSNLLRDASAAMSRNHGAMDFA